MPRTETVSLPANTPGTARSLKINRYGRPGARPKAYIQAGIHADELPANLAAHHLAGRLAEAERAGRLLGEIVLVPLANPIGLANILFHDHQGRFHPLSGQNYNRGWPNVAAAAAEAVRHRLGDDGVANMALLRGAVAEHLEAVVPGNEAETLRLVLMKLAADADIVLDLHTDSESELHLYVDPANWPGASDLAGLLGASVVMFARQSGNDPFEETVCLPCVLAADMVPAAPLAQPFTAVVELRGEDDVADELAARDAEALERFLAHRGVLSGKAEALPAFTGIAAPLEATEVVKAPVGGIVVYKKSLGDMVAAGDVVAEIVDPLADGDQRVPVKAATDGRVFTRTRQRLAWPGAALVKIQGETPLANRVPGKLMLD